MEIKKNSNLLVAKNDLEQETVSNRENLRLPEVKAEDKLEKVQEPARPAMPLQVGVEYGNFARTNEEGLIEVIDTLTGTVLAVQASYLDLFKEKKERLVEVTMPDGKIAYLERGLPLNAVTRKNKQDYQFTELWADLICEEIASGATLKSICKKSGYPPLAIVQRWRREKEVFRLRLLEAERSRADMYHDEIIETARDKERDSKDKRVTVDALKWAAEKNDPEKFGPRMKLSGDPNAPLGFIIDTGIRRSTDEGYLPDATDVTPIEERDEK